MTTLSSVFQTLSLVEVVNDHDGKMADIAHYIKPTGSADDTSYVQTAFNSYSNIVVKAGTYFIEATTVQLNGIKAGVRIPSNRRIEFEEGAIFRVIPNNSDSYRVLDLFASENVTLINPNLTGDRDQHTYGANTAEFGHGIVISTGVNIKIHNPTCNNFTGDGIAINICNNVYIENPQCDNNRRQGISISSAENLEINGGVLSNTNGTAPECGIDLEANDNVGKMKNVKFINITTKNCKNSGIMIIPYPLDGSSEDISITIDNHVDYGSTRGLTIGRFEPANSIKGFIMVSKPSYYDTKGESLYIAGYSSLNTPTVTIRNPTIVNSNANNNSASFPQYASGIVIRREPTQTGTTKIGNIVIDNPRVLETRTTKYMARGIYISDGKDIGCDKITLVSPIVDGIDLLSKIDCDAVAGVKVFDNFETTKLDTTTQFNTLSNTIITKYTNTGATNSLQVNISAYHKGNSSIEFINTTGYGLTIVPPVGMSILPLSAVAGKYINTLQIGASIKLRKLNDTSFIIESIIGNWTVQP